MGAPPPAFTIRHPDYPMSDNVTPFRDYDNMGPLWDPVPFFNSKQRYEEWTTNQLITFEQLQEYGAYYVGDRSDMYTISHFMYYVEEEYMPVFRKISGYDMFTDCSRMRIMRNRNRRAFPKPVCVNSPPAPAPAAVATPTPPPNSQGQQPKRLDIFINVGGAKINPNPSVSSASIDNGTDYMEECGNEEDTMKVDDKEEEEEEGTCFWDEIIEDYFSDKASCSESPGFDYKW